MSKAGGSIASKIVFRQNRATAERSDFAQTPRRNAVAQFEIINDSEDFVSRTFCAVKLQEPHARKREALAKYPGGDLLSHPVAQAVSSALEGLTSVFGMGTGVSPPL